MKILNTGISLKQEWKEDYFIKKQKHDINVSLLLPTKFEYDSQYLYPRIFLEMKKKKDSLRKWRHVQINKINYTLLEFFKKILFIYS